MNFIWDDRKNQANIEKHGLDFGDAHQVFEHPMLVNLDERREYGEERWVGIGLMGTRVVVIAFSEPDADTVRVISFRKASTIERERYEQAYRDEFGAP